MNALEVKNKLPQRYPLLMLDEVVELTAERAVGYKHVTINEPHFRGHFPEAPVMPGVLVMEGLCQLAWLWSGHSGIVRMTGIKKLRFRRPTIPGDRLKLEVELVERTDSGFVLKALASVDDETALTGQLTFSQE